MKTILLSAIFPLLTFAQSIEFTPNRATALYSCGEEMSLSVTVRDKAKNPVNAGKLTIKLDEFNKPVSTMEFDLSKANPVTVKGTMNRPGFLKCVASATLGNASAKGKYAVGFDPLKIKQGIPCPADFDAFWDNAVAKLEKEVPLDPKIEKLEKFSNQRHTSYLVSFATFNNQRVYGLLAVPANRGAGPFPTRVNVPGAGLGQYTPSTGLADNGEISLVLCVHTFPPALDKKEQKRRYDEQDARLKKQYNVVRYCMAGAGSRESYYYYPVILGINRAVNWLAARPDTDKKNFVYTGTSQGGGFGFYLCGLNKHFTKGVSHVPALTGLMGYKADRMSGWPRLVENQPKENRAAAENVAPYFDGANFARRITCPYRVSVGFIDETCPPAAVYSGYNALRVKDKAIRNGLQMTHGVFREIYNELDNRWLRKK